MKQKNKQILYLEEYNCGQCGENFYVRQGARRDWDNNFGCAFGCDDAGKLIKCIEVLILERKGRRETNKPITKVNRDYAEQFDGQGAELSRLTKIEILMNHIADKVDQIIEKVIGDFFYGR